MLQWRVVSDSYKTIPTNKTLHRCAQYKVSRKISYFSVSNAVGEFSKLPIARHLGPWDPHRRHNQMMSSHVVTPLWVSSAQQQHCSEMKLRVVLKWVTTPFIVFIVTYCSELLDSLTLYLECELQPGWVIYALWSPNAFTSFLHCHYDCSKWWYFALHVTYDMRLLTKFVYFMHRCTHFWHNSIKTAYHISLAKFGELLMELCVVKLEL